MSNLWIPFGSDILKRCRINKWKANEEDILETKELIENADTNLTHKKLHSKDKIRCFIEVSCLEVVQKLHRQDFGLYWPQ